MSDATEVFKRRDELVEWLKEQFVGDPRVDVNSDYDNFFSDLAEAMLLDGWVQLKVELPTHFGATTVMRVGESTR